jgi:hypothetical protein
MKIMLIPILVLMTQVAFSQGNPFVRHIFTADPSAHVWDDGRLYVYPSQDISPPNGCDRMDKYHVFSTDDMINWVDHGQIVEAKEVPWGQALKDNATFMWAPDCAYKNGKYYFYFPHPDKDPWNSNWKIGIAVSDKPASDFVILDHWLMGLPESGEIDPCIFIDDDGQVYFYYGGGGRCFGGKLKDNMIELDGELQRMTGLYDFHEGTWVFKRNGIYYLTYADGNSGGNQLRYAIGDNPLGPWSHKGAYLRPTTSDTSHGSVVEYQGQWWAFYHTADLSGRGELRSICVDKLFFNEDGTIRTVVQTKDMGTPYLGILKTTNDIIEAEAYNEGEGYNFKNGQGIAYWSKNIGYNNGDFRLSENVVVRLNSRNRMYYVTNTSQGEYINYTFEVLEDGVYEIDFTIGSVSQSSEARFYIEFDWYKNSNPRRYTAPYAQVSNLPVVTVPNITLSKGIHTLNFYPQGNLNFDKFNFRKNSTSINEINKDEIRLYPNPADGLFQVCAPTIGTITISDSSGRRILEEKMKDVNHTIDLSGYVAGIYILTIQSGEQMYQTNLIKK